MGNAYLYYYPERLAAISRIDLGKKLGDLRPEPVVQGRIEEGEGGHVWPVPRGVYDFVEVVRPGLTDQTVWRKLLNVQRFFSRGVLIGLSNDHAKSFCGKVTSSTARGASSLVVGPNLYAGYSASAALASGDQVVIESAWPECQWHTTTLTSSLAATGGTVTLTDALPAEMKEGPVTLRYYDFYPLLSRRGTGPIVTHRPGRLVFDLAFACRQAIRAQTVVAGRGLGLRGDSAGDGKPTTWDVIGWQLGPEGDDGLGRGAGFGGGLFGGGGTGGKG